MAILVELIFTSTQLAAPRAHADEWRYLVEGTWYKNWATCQLRATALIQTKQYNKSSPLRSGFPFLPLWSVDSVHHNKGQWQWIRWRGRRGLVEPRRSEVRESSAENTRMGTGLDIRDARVTAVLDDPGPIDS